MNLRETQIGTGLRTVLLFIGTGMLTTLISVLVLDVPRTGAAPGVVTELPPQERDLLDQQANAAKAKSQMQKRTITDITHVKLDVDTILRERSISLNFLGVSLDVRRDEVQTRDGIATWVGHVGADKINRAIFTIKDGKIVGTIHNGIHVYQIRPVERSTRGVHTIYKIDQTRFPSEGSHGPPPRKRSFSPNPSSGEIVSYAPASNVLHSSTFPIATVSLPGSTQIDLLVAYGDDVKEAAGTNLDLEIIEAADQTNYTFIDSQIALVLCLVDIKYVPGFRGSGTSVEADLICLIFGDNCTSQAAANAAESIRSSNHADLVSLWVEHGDYCGWAYPNDGSPMESYLGYSVVNRSGATCPTANYSMAHELGHSMGARHDRASAGVPNTNNGKQNYGHFSQTAKQRTIMATDDFCPGCARIGYWSNLLNSLPYKDGTSPMGSANPSNAANNAGTLEANKHTVAGWQNPPSPSCKNPTAVPQDSIPPSSPSNLHIK